MIFRRFDTHETGRAGDLLGYGGLGKRAVVDAHERDLDATIASAADEGVQIVPVIVDRGRAPAVAS